MDSILPQKISFYTKEVIINENCRLFLGQRGQAPPGMLGQWTEDVIDDDLHNFDLLSDMCFTTQLIVLICALSIIVFIFDRAARHCVLLTSCIFCLLRSYTLSSVTFINQKIWRAVINIDESFKFRHG